MFRLVGMPESDSMAVREVDLSRKWLVEDALKQVIALAPWLVMAHRSLSPVPDRF